MYLVLDTETTCKEIYKRKGNPFYNSILCVGYKYFGEPKPLCSTKDYLSPRWSQYQYQHINTLIGHNIKYDLLYIWKDEELQLRLKQGLKIWDTQLVEYMLSGQQHKYPALRDIAVNKYDCKERIKHIQVGFEQGLDTSQIDINLLVEDVTNDVMDTEQVALKQLAKAKDNNLLNLINAQMDSLLATTEMEFNGMYVNKVILNKNKQELLNRLNLVNENINNIVNLSNWPRTVEFNTSSNDYLSLLLFGGKLTYISKIEHGKFKTGKKAGEIRYKNIENDIYLKSRNKPKTKWKTLKEGIYSSNESILKELNDPVAELILEKRYLSKQIDTYYTATEDLIHDFDSCVHAQLCHCGYERNSNEFGGGTSTGRLSCRAPNIQNQPRNSDSKVKQHFTSRFKDGYIIEFDYKMLEVVVFAFLSQDDFLIKDLNSNIDIYIETAKKVYNKENISKDERQIVKRAVLAIIYGAGANKIAMTLNIDVMMAQNIIDVFYATYPITKLWQEKLVKIVNQNRGKYSSFTGRKYIFELRDAPDFLKKRGVLKAYNPSDIKNYPVQGTATADIVLIMLGKLWRNSLNHRNKFLLVNTVHDSIIIDCKKDFLEFTCKFVKDELQSVKETMKKIFNIDFNVNIEVDIKFGDSWYDC